MTRINQHLIQLSQIPASEPIIVSHENLQRIRRRRKTQRRRHRRTQLEPHLEQSDK